MSRPEVDRLLADIRRRGFTARQGRSGHWRIVDRWGRYRGTVPATPSDRRSLLNSRAVLRRTGVLPRPAGGKRPR